MSTANTPTPHDLHTHLIRVFIKHILPKVNLKYIDAQRKIYPVIIGGANITRCAQLSPAARQLVKRLGINDIDFKFAGLAPPKHPKAAEEYIRRIDTLRRAFLRDALDTKRPEFSNILRRVIPPQMKHTLDIRFETNFKYANPPKPINTAIEGAHQAKVRLVRLVSVDAVYYNPQTHEVLDKIRFVDTTIFTPQTMGRDYKLLTPFKDLTKHPDTPVPIYIHKRVLYGSCAWNYIDTVKMLDTYAKTMAESLKPNAPPLAPAEAKFNTQNFIKYLVKFIVMYIQVHASAHTPTHKTGRKQLAPLQLAKIRKLFHRVHELHKQILSDEVALTLATRKALDPRFATLAWFYKHDLDKYTDLKQLRRRLSARGGVAPPRDAA